MQLAAAVSNLVAGEWPGHSGTLPDSHDQPHGSRGMLHSAGDKTLFNSCPEILLAAGDAREIVAAASSSLSIDVLGSCLAGVGSDAP